ncbi:MAG: hypothetical protein IKM73_13590 [Acidaminococcaceae bacterium]|nr:hypothetical protein [Acidaminococcaceae bacterium]
MAASIRFMVILLRISPSLEADQPFVKLALSVDMLAEALTSNPSRPVD